MANRGCNLECVKGGDNAIEFVGPVKIVLVDQPKSAYLRKTCYAALIVLAQMTMATTTILVMFYSLSYKRSACFKALHVFLCTVGVRLIGFFINSTLTYIIRYKAEKMFRNLKP